MSGDGRHGFAAERLAYLAALKGHHIRRTARYDGARQADHDHPQEDEQMSDQGKSTAERYQEIMAQAGPLLAQVNKSMGGLQGALAEANQMFMDLATVALDALTEAAELRAKLEGSDPGEEGAEVPGGPAEQEPPSLPATPVAAFHEGSHKSFLEDFQAVRSVVVSTDMDKAEVRERVLAAECNKPGSRIVLRNAGAVHSLDFLQLGHANGINGADGQPLRDIEIVGEDDPVVQGVAMQPQKGSSTGCGRGVRLRYLEVRPTASGWCILIAKGAAETGAHLVGDGLTVRAIPSPAFEGCGGKWGLLSNEARITLRDFHVASPFQEHGAYIHTHQGGVYVENMWNTPSVITHPATGRQMLVGLGRTLFQSVSRSNEGPMPWGDVELDLLSARRCGWQGLHDHIDADGVLDPSYQYSGGGGSALTFAGVVRGAVKIRAYDGVGNYCSELAAWPEVAKLGTGYLELEPTKLNPHRIRAYLTGLDGQPFGPTLEQREARGYSVDMLDIEGFQFERAKATRQAFLLDAVRHTRMAGVAASGRAILDPKTDPEVRLGFYPWAEPCGSFSAE